MKGHIAYTHLLLLLNEILSMLHSNAWTSVICFSPKKINKCVCLLARSSHMIKILDISVSCISFVVYMSEVHGLISCTIVKSISMFYCECSCVKVNYNNSYFKKAELRMIWKREWNSKYHSGYEAYNSMLILVLKNKLKLLYILDLDSLHYVLHYAFISTIYSSFPLSSPHLFSFLNRPLDLKKERKLDTNSWRESKSIYTHDYFSYNNIYIS
jgi:hypothetical protein